MGGLDGLLMGDLDGLVVGGLDGPIKKYKKIVASLIKF